MVLNALYKHTALQSRFPCNAVAIVAGTPETLSLKQFLRHFLDFRVDVVRRRAGCAPSSVHFCILLRPRNQDHMFKDPFLDFLGGRWASCGGARGARPPMCTPASSTLQAPAPSCWHCFLVPVL